MEWSVPDCLKQGQDVSHFFPGADTGNDFAAGLIRSCSTKLPFWKNPSFQQVTHLPRAPRSGQRSRNWMGTAPLLCGSPLSTNWHHWGNKEGLQNSGVNRGRDVFGGFFKKKNLKTWDSETYLGFFYQTPVITKKEHLQGLTQSQRGAGAEGREGRKRNQGITQNWP